MSRCLQRARLDSLVKNSGFHPPEGAGGFSLPNRANGLRVALATGLSFEKPNRLFHQSIQLPPNAAK